MSLNQDLDAVVRAMQAYGMLVRFRSEVGDEMLQNIMGFLRFYYVSAITGHMPDELTEKDKQVWLDILDTGDLAATAAAELEKEGIRVDTGGKS
jgi:hypothetical protein